MDDGYQPTSYTLLEKLAQAKGTAQWQEAWSRFALIYLPLIIRLCRRYGVKECDLDDVCQEVQAKLMSAMARFEYRRWLKVVLVRAMQTFLDQEPGPPDGDIARIQSALSSARQRARSNRTDAGESALIANDWAGRVLADVTKEEEERFSHEWWASRPALWSDSRPSFPYFFRSLLPRSFAKWGLEDPLPGLAASKLQEQIEAILPSLEKESMPKFRAWVSAVVHNAACDLLKQLKKDIPNFSTLGIDDEGRLEGDAAAFVRDLELRDIRAEAENRCGARVSRRDWSYFVHMFYDGLTGPQIAERYETTTGSVYVAIGRVKAKYIEEYEKLEGELQC